MSNGPQPMSNVKSIVFGWLCAPDASHLDGEIGVQAFGPQVPAEHGTSISQLHNTSHGVTLIESKHDFRADVVGPTYALARISGEFDTETVAFGATKGGRITHREYIPARAVTFGLDRNYFRHSRRFEICSTLETAAPIEATFASLPVQALDMLIGEELRGTLFHALEIAKAPEVRSHPVPLRISRILLGAINPHLTGRLGMLYSQAKILEYLCELIDHLESRAAALAETVLGRDALYEVRDYLTGLEGKLPSLVDIAEMMQVSARALNDGFSREFGASLPRYVSGLRLEQAHSAIQESDIALKVLSDRLGYSNVSHFSTAFKRQFGYPPGSLRRK